MDTNKKFDNLMKDYLGDISEKIDCEPEMLKQIEEGIKNSEGKAGHSRNNNPYKNFFGLNMKRVALIVICFVVMSMGLTVMVSAEARNLVKDAYNSVISIFIVKETKDGINISEVPDTILMDQSFSGQLDDRNITSEEVKKKFGVDLFFPNEFGGRCTKIISSCITTVYQISYRESEDLASKLLTGDQDALFVSLKNKKKNTLGCVYFDNKSYKNFWIYMESAAQKPAETGKMLEKIDIEGVQCRYTLRPYAEYQTKQYSTVTSDDRTIKGSGEDMSKEPYYIGKYYYIKWTYNNVDYTVRLENESDYDDAKEFVGVYIKELKKWKSK
ncbi:hypothetical protein [Pseudobacteroides cellulosolvens]|uniref:DUF4367 domain-containing protein n=1 Tax=Pseudobacteroides cellulosolvens ATCC 35603 = DSM 2933 TaxID=398512 RepID=A0A0L6JUX3_9FIRM|nr:hypothetical protein [Pseudobacteroides cellulosolvens]KNY29661.1 hypothetical protein Bccel_4935 [Pseudobacteroides cellulosolvens ATCC 35603 = DSM 2933]